RADVDDHIDLARAVSDRSPGLAGFHVRSRSPERKSNDRADADAASIQEMRSQEHPGGVDTDVGELEVERLATQGFDVLSCRLGPQERMLDQPGDFPAGHCLLPGSLPRSYRGPLHRS